MPRKLAKQHVSLWHNLAMLNWWLRYQPVVRLIEDERAQHVLDVGSGWHGLSMYRDGFTIQTDLRFRGGRPTAAATAGTHYVAASAEELPFGNSAVDFVVSLDLLEHLPEELRPRAIRELCRVARLGVVVGCPIGSLARGLDLVLYAAIRLAAGASGIPSWLQEHREQVRYPDRDSILSAIPADWRLGRECRSGNLFTQGVLVFLENVARLDAIPSRLEQRWSHEKTPRFLDWPPAYRRLFVLRPV